MGSSLHHLYSIFALVTLFSFIITCAIAQSATTIATWSGNPHGAGSESGKCGFDAAVEFPPLNKLVSAGGSRIFNNGIGCGVCYQVQCTSNPACSGKPINITITDICPGSCGAYQFDLSGTAFGALALPGKDDQLRNVGQIQIQYQRIPCNYPGFKVVFLVDSSSTPLYFATKIEPENGEGDIGKVELKQANSDIFVLMQEAPGSTWKLNSPTELKAPFTIRLTTRYLGTVLVANNVIPAGWRPGQTFTYIFN